MFMLFNNLQSVCQIPVRHIPVLQMQLSGGEDGADGVVGCVAAESSHWLCHSLWFYDNVTCGELTCVESSHKPAESISLHDTTTLYSDATHSMGIAKEGMGVHPHGRSFI